MAASASAAGGLLSIIRDLAHGERAVSGLKRRLDDVIAAADADTAELEAAKRRRETELPSTPVQPSIAAAASQVNEYSEGDDFLTKMLEMNARIRKFQQMAELCFGLSAGASNVSDNDEAVKNFLDEKNHEDLLDCKKARCETPRVSTVTTRVERPKAAGRPMTVYMLFLQDFRKDHKKELTVKISKAASDKWKIMTDSEKAPYKKKYDELLRARRNHEPAAPVVQLSSDSEDEPMQVHEHPQEAAPVILLSSDSEDVQIHEYERREYASSSMLSGPEPSSCESVKSKCHIGGGAMP